VVWVVWIRITCNNFTIIMATPCNRLRVFVSYSSLEREFACAQFWALAQLVAKLPRCEVTVSVGARLFSGEPEDEAHIAALMREHPLLSFVRFEVSTDTPAYALHNASRARGVQRAMRELSGSGDFWALFLDGDEIVEPGPFAEWFTAHVSNASDICATLSYKLANLWYFLEPTIVSEELEDSVLLVHSSLLGDAAALQHPRERDGILEVASRNGFAPPARNVVHAGKPMFHHFSWVRGSAAPAIRDAGGESVGRSAAREGLLRKVANWGHSADRDWPTLIAAAFDALEAGAPHPDTDFVHGRRLRRLRPDEPRIL
jgi:hypothetical protein